MLERVKMIYRAMTKGITPQFFDNLPNCSEDDQKIIFELISLSIKYYYRGPEEIVDIIREYDARRSKTHIFLPTGGPRLPLS